MYRQGDVLIVPIKGIDVSKLEKVEREDGEVVLAHGEATGHRHRISVPFADLYERPDGPPTVGERILHVRKVSARAGEVSRQIAELLHEEHSTIEIPAGTYRVIRQIEYSPEEIRMVAD